MVVLMSIASIVALVIAGGFVASAIVFGGSNLYAIFMLIGAGITVWGLFTVSNSYEKQREKKGNKPNGDFWLLLPANSTKMTATADKKNLNDRVEEVLETVRPHLRVDGGDVELVEVTEDMHVKIRWMGMCESCSMSAMTLRAGIQEAVRSKIPEIVGVEAVN